MLSFTHQQKQNITSFGTGLSAAVLLIVLCSLVFFIMLKGSAYFWPSQVFKITTYENASEQENPVDTARFVRSGSDIEAFSQSIIDKLDAQFANSTMAMPQVVVEKVDDVYQINMQSGASLHGFFEYITTNDNTFRTLDALNDVLTDVELLQEELTEIQNDHLIQLHRRIASLDQNQVAQDAPARIKEQVAFDYWQGRANALNLKIDDYRVVFTDAMGQKFSLYVKDIEHLFTPNQLTWVDKLSYAADKMLTFVSESPKQASTSGGVFPALFGTVLMVVLMAIIVAPFGAMAAIYLHEYAPNNKTTSVIRICVSNMAGVPSVVYGVFGLGFFVYTLGGSIDELFYSSALPSPTFGTPGLFWAALTMALLTLPVVIVSTEEGLRRVPKGLRSGSYALGATKIETIWKTVLPIASPGIMTGVILAVARAAGEVAPLILVGAVKFAPNLPIDGEFPFIHFERQFMHLGVFVYDGAFHNQTNTQGSSMMFASCMLLLLIVFVLNLSAIIVRNKLRDRYLRI
jgi:phosphate transport system permease protein